MYNLIKIINANIGREWDAQRFDCWAFVRLVYSQAYGIDLPILPGVNPENCNESARAALRLALAGDWIKVDQPRPGDCILMTKRTRPHHVGIYLSESGRAIVAHCDTASGSVCQTLSQLSSQGWGGFIYYRHKDLA